LLGIQKDFIKKYLSNFYSKCKEKDIEVMAFFGNDDLYTRKVHFRKIGSLLDETLFFKDGYEFKAYPYVQDYPFGLKTACKWDSDNWRCPDRYIHTPRDIDENGWIEITDIDKYFYQKNTIENDLSNIHATPKTIMAIHQPPSGMGLDVCINGRKVGSKAVQNWIQKEQPLLVLTGHIHESPQVTGLWKGNIGKTLVIQPGPAIVDIKIDDTSINACLQL
jgi:Icc-related predicted phosphoesterase